MENKNLIAVVEKKVNGKINQELLSTKELRFLNPWILIDYYENRINKKKKKILRFYFFIL